MTIHVFYSCRACGLSRVGCDVPARTTEDVITWTENILGAALQADHVRRSPHCIATQAQDVMIPIAGVEKIGGPSLS